MNKKQRLKEYKATWTCKGCKSKVTSRWMIPFGSEAEEYLTAMDSNIDAMVESHLKECKRVEKTK